MSNRKRKRGLGHVTDKEIKALRQTRDDAKRLCFLMPTPERRSSCERGVEFFYSALENRFSRLK